MAALNIPAIARLAVGNAWSLAASVLTDCTLTDEPAVVRDPVTEAETITWGFTFSLLKANKTGAFFWDSKEEIDEGGDQAAMDAALAVEKRMAMVRVVDCPGITEVSTLAKITEGAKVWNVLKADAPPGGAIYILTLRR